MLPYKIAILLRFMLSSWGECTRLIKTEPVLFLAMYLLKSIYFLYVCLYELVVNSGEGVVYP